MDSLRQLGPSAAPTRSPETFDAEILDDATTPGQEVRCKRPSISEQAATDPMPWVPVTTAAGEFWPKQGNHALVVYPVGGPPAIVFWEPSEGAVPDVAVIGEKGAPGKDGAAGKDGVLVGEIKDWGGINLPTAEGQEYKWADGSAISRTTYATLFALYCISTTGNRTSGSKALKAIPSTAGMKVGMPVSGTGIQSGTTIETVNSASEITLTKTAESTGTGGAFVVAPHGVGDGTATFNLPDFRGRVGVAPDDMGGSDAGRVSTAAQQLGGSGGAERHALSEAEMPSHSHAGPAASAFVHDGLSGTPAGLVSGGGSFVVSGPTAAVGGGGAHQNMPPFLNVNRIIRVA